MFTGTDEHGQNVERAAKNAGGARADYATRVAAEFFIQWELFGLKWTAQSAPPTRATTRPCTGCSSAASTTATSTREPTPASTAFTTSCTSTTPSPAIRAPIAAVPPKPSPRKITSSSSPRFSDRLLELYEEQPRIHPARDAAQRGDLVRQAGPQRPFHHAHHHQVGHSGSGRRPPRVLCVVRRADRLHQRGAERRRCGPPTCT